MEYKIIATDFDGTLLRSDKTISKETEETFLELKEKKYLIVGVTARNLSSVKRVCNINLFDYLILNNGTYIYDIKNKNGNQIGSVDYKIAKEITNYFENISYEIDYCSIEKYYSNIEKENFQFINSIDEIKEIISRMNIFVSDNSKIIEYKEYIEKKWKNVDCFVMQDTDSFSNKKWLVVMPKSFSKLFAIELLCKNLKINLNSVIFFGDSGNDIEVIQNVGMGVAMANAIDIVKSRAKAVTLSNDENGISVYLKRILKF